MAKIPKCDRRRFLKLLGLTLLATQLSSAALRNSSPQPIIKPPRLKLGDTIGLISPASQFVDQASEYLQDIIELLSQLGLKVKLGAHIFDQYGYLAGKDKDRARDVNSMFADDSVQALLTIRGGWGCNRILPLLDYNLIRQNPKIIMGYSDITSLLLAIYARSGVITFHGPVGISTWNAFSVGYVEQILLNGKAVTLRNPFDIAGILEQLAGFIFAQCTNCTDQEDEDQSLTLQEVLADHIKPLGIPAWYGSMIGHIEDKFTVPVGLEVEIDALQGTIRMLESAVTY
ncbi:MAG: LD-carboxypeptidase [Xenococcaceae cyanobacterium]